MNACRRMPAPVGNIKPYKDTMISRIGDSLQRLSTSYAHDQGQQYPVVLIEIERDGRLLRCEIIDSSGSPRLDNDALDAFHRI